jgi:Tripartite tricarboxylate transporter TctB family
MTTWLGRNRMAAGACAVLAVALFIVTFGFEEMPESITRGFGAEIFPRLVLGVILVLCALLALAKENDGQQASPIPWKVFGAGALLVGFMGLLKFAGMLAAMVVFLITAGWLWDERRLGLLTLSSVLVTGAIWAVFVKGFGIPLPLGLIGQWAGY